MRYLGQWIFFLSSLLSLSNTAWACKACFGNINPDDLVGIQSGIVLMLILVLVMLSGFAAFFLYLRKRSQAYDEK